MNNGASKYSSEHYKNYQLLYSDLNVVLRLFLMQLHFYMLCCTHLVFNPALDNGAMACCWHGGIASILTLVLKVWWYWGIFILTGNHFYLFCFPIYLPFSSRQHQVGHLARIWLGLYGFACNGCNGCLVVSVIGFIKYLDFSIQSLSS